MIHVTCGITGSGKTALSKQLAIEYNATLYCYDVFPRQNWREDVHENIYKEIIKTLYSGEIVVYDDLNLSKLNRLSLLNAISKTNCKKILHVMKTPPNICLERMCLRDKRYIPKAVIDYYCERYEEPTLDEGWDEIIYHEYIEEVISHDN